MREGSKLLVAVETEGCGSEKWGSCEVGMDLVTCHRDKSDQEREICHRVNVLTTRTANGLKIVL